MFKAELYTTHYKHFSYCYFLAVPTVGYAAVIHCRVLPELCHSLALVCRPLGPSSSCSQQNTLSVFVLHMLFFHLHASGVSLKYHLYGGVYDYVICMILFSLGFFGLVWFGFGVVFCFVLFGNTECHLAVELFFLLSPCSRHYSASREERILTLLCNDLLTGK